jgi:hypothetical protein
MIKQATGAVLAIAVSGSAASAAVIAEYTFAGNTLTSSDTDPLSTATTFNNGVGYTNTGFTSNSRRVTGAGGFGSASNNADPLNGEYFTFTVTPTSPLDTLNIAGLSFDALRGGGSPDDVSAFYLIDGGPLTSFADISAETVSTAFNTESSGTLNLTANSSFEVRIVFHGNNQGNGSNRVDNVVLDGSVTVIPEPSSLAAVGLLGLVGLRRRR